MASISDKVYYKPWFSSIRFGTSAPLQVLRSTVLLTVVLLFACMNTGQAQLQLQADAITSGGTVASSGAVSLEGSVGQIATTSSAGSNTHSFGGLWPTIYSSDLITDIKEEEPGKKERPKEFSLKSAYPNPFNPSTTIKYTLPEASRVTLSVYNMLGKRVRVLVDKRQNAGEFTVKFTADQLSSGIYLYRLRADDFVKERKMTLVK